MYASHSLILPEVIFLWYNEAPVPSSIHREAHTSFLFFPFAFLSFYPTSPSPSSQLKSIDLNGTTWPPLTDDTCQLYIIHGTLHMMNDQVTCPPDVGLWSRKCPRIAYEALMDGGASLPPPERPPEEDVGTCGVGSSSGAPSPRLRLRGVRAWLILEAGGWLGIGRCMSFMAVWMLWLGFGWVVFLFSVYRYLSSIGSIHLHLFYFYIHFITHTHTHTHP